MYFITCLLSLFLLENITAAPPRNYDHDFGYGYPPNQARLEQRDSQSLKRSPPHGLPQPLDSPTPTTSAQKFGSEKYLPPTTTTAPPTVHKQFFLVTAEEDAEENRSTKHLVIGRPQKNYRVVFIKAPSSVNSKVKYTAEFAPQEEKTVIYVLSKKANELEASDIATPAPQQATKPEVYFIKYKTPEEATAAQKEIQEQYDQLGGTSDFSDEGTAPVHSVIGSLEGAASNGNNDYKEIKTENVDTDDEDDMILKSRQYFLSDSSESRRF